MTLLCTLLWFSLLAHLVLCSLCEFVSEPHSVNLLRDLQKFVMKELKAITKVNQVHYVANLVLKPKTGIFRMMTRQLSSR